MEASVPFPNWKKYDPKYRAVADYFGIENNHDWAKYGDKIDYFYDWASKVAKSDEPTKLMGSLRLLEKKIGNPAWNEKRVDYAYRTLRLEGDRIRLETNKPKPRPTPVDPKVQAEEMTKLMAKTISSAISKELKGLKEALTPKEAPKEEPKEPEPQSIQEGTNYVGNTQWW